MHDMINELYDLCETLSETLKKTNEKLKRSNGQLSASDMEYVNWLTHSVKSIVSTIETKEKSDGYSEAGEWEGMARGHFGDRGTSYATRDSRRRDNRGRFSRDGRMRDGRYSRADSKEHMIEQLEDMMEEADGRVKSAIRKCISELERD